jgi:hypothetical protein
MYGVKRRREREGGGRERGRETILSQLFSCIHFVVLLPA